MALELKTFQFSETQWFTCHILTFQVNGEPQFWFAGKQLARMLDYADPTKALNLVQSEWKESFKNLVQKYMDDSVSIQTPPNWQFSTLFISEPGMYILIAKSSKPAAVKFMNFIYSVVLPSLRKTGIYVNEEYKQKFNLLLAGKEGQISQLTSENNELISSNQEYGNTIRRLELSLKNSECALQDMHEKYQTKLEDVVPKTKNHFKFNQLHVFEKDSNEEKGKLYTMRNQILAYDRLLARLKKMYPNISLKFVIDYSPNPINLMNRVKEQLNDKIRWHYNHITLLDGYTIEEFEKDVRSLANYSEKKRSLEKDDENNVAKCFKESNGGDQVPCEN